MFLLNPINFAFIFCSAARDNTGDTSENFRIMTLVADTARTSA
jgi:hypothetical protein